MSNSERPHGELTPAECQALYDQYRADHEVEEVPSKFADQATPPEKIPNLKSLDGYLAKNYDQLYSWLCMGYIRDNFPNHKERRAALKELENLTGGRETPFIKNNKITGSSTSVPCTCLQILVDDSQLTETFPKMTAEIRTILDTEPTLQELRTRAQRANTSREELSFDERYTTITEPLERKTLQVLQIIEKHAKQPTQANQD